VTVLDNFVRGTRENLAPAAEDDRVEVVEGSILDVDLLDALMRDTHYAFHLAALWLFECVHEPRRALEHNVVGTYNVIEAAQRADVRKVVYSSSASVYGEAERTPMDEDHPFNNTTMYGATKIAGEQFLRAFHQQHGLDWVGLRYFNAYGPRMDYRGAYVSVIMKVLDKLDAGEPPVIFGDGSQAYDFVHVHDVARANICALKSDATDASYNVATGERTSIRELVDELLSITGVEVEPEYRVDEPMFVKQRLGGTEAAARELGFTARVPVREGLSSVVEWRRRDQRKAVVEAG
jgi:UDP-glucose 4-epimerase